MASDRGKLAPNPLREKLAAGATAYGIYVDLASPTVVELAGIAGLDFVRIDWAHAPLDLPQIENMIRAAETSGVVPLVRLECDEQKITSVLEMGAMGVVVPGIASAAEAEAAVGAAKFAPIGRRGMFSASRQSRYGAVGGAALREWVNAQTLVGIQIESLEALENLDAILDVRGIDVVQSGRGDIANALNLPGQKNHPDVIEVETRIFSAAARRGLAVSPQLDPDAADFADGLRRALDQGARMISLGVDLSILKRAFEATVQKASAAARG